MPSIRDEPIKLRLLAERRFIPDCCASASSRYVSSVRVAIRLWTDALQREPTTNDLAIDAVVNFFRRLRYVGYKKRSLREYAKRVRALWRYAHRLGVAAQPRRFYIAVNGKIVISRRQKLFEQPVLLPPPPGTVEHYFETIYCPQDLLGVSPGTIDEYRWHLHSLFVHHGRHVLLRELTDVFLAEHFRWMLDQGRTAWGVNNFRKYLFAVWRHAASRGLVDRAPLLKPLRVKRGAPDAWTIDEMKRILSVANEWWSALLLVGYWTLQRRRALFSIPVANVDLDAGWIDFPPAAMKSAIGIRCRVGADAVAAIRRLAPLDRELLFVWPGDEKERDRQFRALLRRAGVAPSKRKNGLFHKLRRTGATHAVIRGGMVVVCDLLGQSDVYVTKRYIDKTQLPGHDVTRLLPLLVPENVDDEQPPQERI